MAPQTVEQVDQGCEQQKSCNLFCRLLHRHLPITRWLPQYTFTKLQCDIVSGITIGLMVIPQGLAYASVARLPAQYGLFSAYMGCFVYCFFGSAKDLAIGPTSILSLMVSIYAYPEDPRFTVTFTFYVGIILLLMGFLRLGFLVKFISVPVLSGFTSAAAITIAAGQLKNVFGLDYVSPDFVPGTIDLFKQIGKTNSWDLILGVGCIALLVILKRLGGIDWGDDGPETRAQKVARKFLWFVGIGRNTIVILVAMGIVCCVIDAGYDGYLTLSYDIQGELQSFKMPEFSIKSENQTYSAVEVLESFDTGLVVVPIIAFVEAVAVGKVFSRKNGYKMDPTQDLIALGLANIFGSFVSSYPVTGSFSRTAVNSQSGVQTPLSGVFTGLVVMIAVEYLTPYFQYIPKACLGAIIITAVITMVDFSTCRHLWKFKRVELLPLGITFFASFYTLEFGLLAGVLVSLGFVLYPVLYPPVVTEKCQVLTVRLSSGVLYPGTEHVLRAIEDLISAPEPPASVVVDFSGVTNVDFTFLHELVEVCDEARKHNVNLIFSGVRTQLHETLMRADLSQHIDASIDVGHSVTERTNLLTAM